MEPTIVQLIKKYMGVLLNSCSLYNKYHIVLKLNLNQWNTRSEYGYSTSPLLNR